MKVKTLQINKFKGLKDFFIDFNSDVTVLIGKNGTGKTTILETIYYMLTYDANVKSNIPTFTPHSNSKPDLFFTQNSTFDGCRTEIELFQEKRWLTGGYFEYEKGLLYSNNPLRLELVRNNTNGIAHIGEWDVMNYISTLSIVSKEKKEIPHIVYMPTEINFKKYRAESVKKLDKSIEFGLILDSDTVSKDLKDFLIYQHYRDLEDNESRKKGSRIKKYKDLYNSFFEDKEFIGIKDLEPLFKIKATGETHSVDELSSGEKQIFFRAGSILEYELENCIILIDEPEISMHPEWQQKILDFYRKVAGRNQLIIATHSPHIVSSCKKEEVRVLVKNKDKIEIKDYVEGTYGRTIEQLLFSVFNLESVRDPNVQRKIDRFKDLYLDKEQLNSNEKEEMQKLIIELKSYLDPDDPELSLIDIKKNTNELKNLLNELERK